MKKLFLLLALVSVVSALLLSSPSYSGNNADAEHPNSFGWHWAKTTPELRLGVEYGPGVDVTNLKEALADWSASPRVELGVIGPIEDPSACEAPGSYIGYKNGVIVACTSPESLVGGSTSLVTECNLTGNAPGCDSDHIVAGAIYSRFGISQRVWCHEMGHALGLAHGGDGCMEEGTTDQCPRGQDFATLESIYSHTDSFDTALQGVTLSQGSPTCGGGTTTPTPTSTPTPTNTPTPTSTISPTPTLSPTPTVCVPQNPRSKKCK